MLVVNYLVSIAVVLSSGVWGRPQPGPGRKDLEPKTNVTTTSTSGLYSEPTDVDDLEDIPQEKCDTNINCHGGKFCHLPIGKCISCAELNRAQDGLKRATSRHGCAPCKEGDEENDNGECVKKSYWNIVIYVAVGVVAVMLLALGLFLCYKIKRSGWKTGCSTLQLKKPSA